MARENDQVNGTSLDLAPIRKRLAALPTPQWGWIYYDGFRGLAPLDEGKPVIRPWCADHGDDCKHELLLDVQDDAAHFIEYAPDDVAALIAEVERLRAGISRVEKLARIRLPWRHRANR